MIDDPSYFDLYFFEKGFNVNNEHLDDCLIEEQFEDGIDDLMWLPAFYHISHSIATALSECLT